VQNAQLVQAPRGVEATRFESIGDPDPPSRMPRSEHPLVSIVIPVHNQWVYTAACLRSIAEAECKAAFEVIVIDDASTDETPGRLARIRDLDAVSNDKNLGFIGSCNRGAARANGDFIVMLNNDTQVMDGWLDRLLQTFRQFPDTGIAGARLVYPDGSLQECGGIVFNDGSGWNYGRGDNPDRPEYQFVREVDYCSGACIMLRHQVFKELEGFDKEYAPAYYEDTDLAFRVREMGLKVRVQPAAVVVHHEGISSGTDLNSGAKRNQAVNRKKFLKSWKERLAVYPSPIVNPKDRDEIRAACDHRLKGQELIVDAYTPEPDQDSGSLRMRYLMDCLQDLGYGVSFIPDNRSHVRRYTDDLQLSGVEAW
jgi:GT2 family glycosyltransferase